jgi:hypothetical protein
MLYDSKKWDLKAPTFKTAKELRISTKLYNALVQVYWMLKDGKIPDELFTMSNICGPRISGEGKPCGSAGCILGWVQAVEPKLGGVDYDYGAPHYLFFPEVSGSAGGAIVAGRDRAIRALHNYLTTGRADWRGVMNS